jgi:glycosyltransferase involved in cell wall biosynthesis
VTKFEDDRRIGGDSISVILPNYNHGKYLKRAIEALLAQNPAPREIVVIDDASTDDSLATLDVLARRSAKIRVLKHAENKGLVAAQNGGLAVASGNLIYLAAADDWVLPGFFATAMEMLAKYPEAGLFCGDALLVRGLNNRFLGLRPIVPPRFRPAMIEASRVARMLAHSDNWILTGSAVIRQEAIAAAGGLDAELNSVADGFLTKKIALTRGFCYAPRVVSVWTIFPTGVSRSAALTLEQAFNVLRLIPQKLAADPAFPPWYAQVFSARWRFAASRLALKSKPAKLPILLGMNLVDNEGASGTRLLSALSRGRLGHLGLLAWMWFRFRPYRLMDLVAAFLFRRLFMRSNRIAVSYLRERERASTL